MTDPAVAVAASAAWVEADGVVYAASLPDGPPLVLTGPGAVVWRAAVPGGSLADVVARVADAADSSADVVAADVADFVARLASAGVLTVTPAH